LPYWSEICHFFEAIQQQCAHFFASDKISLEFIYCAVCRNSLNKAAYEVIFGRAVARNAIPQNVFQLILQNLDQNDGQLEQSVIIFVR
jgi:hypothetical protein